MWCRRRNGSGRRRSGGRKINSVGLWEGGMGWADFSSPLLHVAVNRNDFLSSVLRRHHAEFSLVTIGWIGRIFRAAIQKCAIEMSWNKTFWFDSCSSRGQISITNARICMDWNRPIWRYRERPYLLDGLNGQIGNDQCPEHWRAIVCLFLFCNGEAGHAVDRVNVGVSDARPCRGIDSRQHGKQE